MTKPKNNPTKPPVPEAQSKAVPDTPVADKKVADTAAENAPEAEAEKAPETEVKNLDINHSEATIKRAKEVFESHNVEEVFFTSDGTAFLDQQYALMHTENLQDKRWFGVKKSEV